MSHRCTTSLADPFFCACSVKQMTDDATAFNLEHDHYHNFIYNSNYIHSSLNHYSLCLFCSMKFVVAPNRMAYSALHVRLESKSHEKLFVLVVRDWCHAAGFRSGNCVVLRTFTIMAPMLVFSVEWWRSRWQRTFRISRVHPSTLSTCPHMAHANDTSHAPRSLHSTCTLTIVI